MEKDFDFKNIGKRMPYRIPDGFFEKNQKQVSERTQTGKRNRWYKMKLVISAALAAAAIMLGVVFLLTSQPVAEELQVNSLIVSMDLDNFSSDVMERYIESMSDEELAEWVELSENDIFIN